MSIYYATLEVETLDEETDADYIDEIIRDQAYVLSDDHIIVRLHEVSTQSGAPA
jgi:hypothetical protein